MLHANVAILHILHGLKPWPESLVRNAADALYPVVRDLALLH